MRVALRPAAATTAPRPTTNRRVTNREAHEYARTRGVSPLLYRIVRAIALAFMRAWFRLEVQGAEHIPRRGAAIICPNHKSFWDAFFVGAATRRPLRYMAKTELIEGRFGPLLVRLGAFPVRRGEADADAVETARQLLRQGELLVIFPEGTRVRDPERLGAPHRGAGRLSIETGAPLVPAAIAGTDHLFVGPIPKPRKVRVAIGRPLPPPPVPATPDAARELVERALWPRVETEYRRLRERPGLVATLLALIGLAGYEALRRLGERSGRRLPQRGPRSRRQRRSAPRPLGLGRARRR